MIIRLSLVLVASYIVVGDSPSVAGDAGRARMLVAEAIKAHGGEGALAKTHLMTRKVTGVMSYFGQDLPFTDEMVMQLPARWRWALEGGAPGQKAQIRIIINGNKGWQSAGAAAVDIGQDRLDELREETYVIWLTSLTPLQKDPGFELASIADAQVNGQPAAGIKVTHKGHADVKLFFDKQSGLLVKAERRAREAGLAVDKEYVYSAHKVVEGVRLPTKYVELTNGKKLVEVSAIAYQFHSSLDDRTFAKP